MNSKTLLEKSAKVKAEADKWLEETNIEQILSKYGKFSLEGSYAYNLMMNGDIDMYVIMEETSREKALMIFNEIVNNVPQFNGYKFSDLVHNQRWEGIPEGYCFNLDSKKDGVKWKFDIWLFTQAQFDAIPDYSAMIYKCLTNEKKEAILHLKDFRNVNNLKVPSVKIYDAVLRDNVMSIEDFREYIRR